MNIIIEKDFEKMSKRGAAIITEIIKKQPETVLGLATGSTPMGLYKELVKTYKEDGLSFSEVVTFNLDEYLGLHKTDKDSYYYYMYENLFNHINIKPENIFIPDGTVEDVEKSCSEYEAKIKNAGGINLQVLGVGTNGHVGFNEPGSQQDSRTREIALTPRTIKDNSRFFNNSVDNVPKKAITMGMGTILEVGKIILLACGAHKANAVFKTIEEPMTSDIPSSLMMHHKDLTIILDEEAAGKLSAKYRN